jgi:hypothetical protein
MKRKGVHFIIKSDNKLYNNKIFKSMVDVEEYIKQNNNFAHKIVKLEL